MWKIPNAAASRVSALPEKYKERKHPKRVREQNNIRLDFRQISEPLPPPACRYRWWAPSPPRRSPPCLSSSCGKRSAVTARSAGPRAVPQRQARGSHALPPRPDPRSQSEVQHSAGVHQQRSEERQRECVRRGRAPAALPAPRARPATRRAADPPAWRRSRRRKRKGRALYSRARRMRGPDAHLPPPPPKRRHRPRGGGFALWRQLHGARRGGEPRGRRAQRLAEPLPGARGRPLVARPRPGTALGAGRPRGGGERGQRRGAFPRHHGAARGPAAGRAGGRLRLRARLPALRRGLLHRVRPLPQVRARSVRGGALPRAGAGARGDPSEPTQPRLPPRVGFWPPCAALPPLLLCPRSAFRLSPVVACSISVAALSYLYTERPQLNPPRVFPVRPRWDPRCHRSQPPGTACRGLSVPVWRGRMQRVPAAARSAAWMCRRPRRTPPSPPHLHGVCSVHALCRSVSVSLKTTRFATFWSPPVVRFLCCMISSILFYFSSL